MRKLIFVFAAILIASSVNAQSGRGVRIGYIDMNYILENVPDYLEAKNQLELKAQKWKQEIEAKKGEIAKLKEELSKERVLLTKQLIEEKEEEILFQTTELDAVIQKHFGPQGDYPVQKAVLVKPVQDQVFTAIQDIAEAKKYDFVFDKSSDLTMIFSAKRFDISDQVIRAISRASKRTQKSKKEIKEEEKKEYEENLEDENPALAERRRKLDEKKAARDKLVEERKAAVEQKKAAAAAKRQEQLDAREASRTGAAPKSAPKNTEEDPSKPEQNDGSTDTPQDSTYSAKPAKPAVNKDSIAAVREAQRLAKLEARDAAIAKRKQELEARKAKLLEEREAAKRAREQNKDGVKPDEQTTPTPKNNN